MGMIEIAEAIKLASYNISLAYIIVAFIKRGK
jgi:hypothetical protein